VLFANVPLEVSEEDTLGIFSVYGKVISFSYKNGYGFVRYLSEVESNEAVENMNGALLDEDHCLVVSLKQE